MWRDDAYLLDMLLAAEEIEKQAKGITWDKFSRDIMLQSGFMSLILTVGEAASKVSKELQEAHPEIAWREVIAMRNRLVHEYFRIIPERVWDVIASDIAPLVEKLRLLVPPDQDG